MPDASAASDVAPRTTFNDAESFRISTPSWRPAYVGMTPKGPFLTHYDYFAIIFLTNNGHKMFSTVNQKILSSLLILSIIWITLFGALHFANNSTINSKQTVVAVSPCHQSQISKTTSSQSCQKTSSFFNSILTHHYYWDFSLSGTIIFLTIIVSIARSPFNRLFKPPRK